MGLCVCGLVKADSLTLQAPIQRLADRIASVFVPAIVSLAILTLFAWTIVVGVASHDPQVSIF